VLSFGVAVLACAQTVVNINDRGWYSSAGAHNPGNNNTFTGQIGTTVYRSYFRFSIPASLTCITSATLELELENHYSAPLAHDLTLHDVSAVNVPLLDTTNGSGSGTAIHTDLGSGTVYGTETGIVNGDIGTVFSFALPSAALTDIAAAAGSDFAVGAQLTVGGPSGTRGVRFSGGNEARVHRLTLNACPPPPDLSVTKTQAVYDPGATGAYALPGNDVIYTITVTNSGVGSTDANSLVLIDAMPDDLAFFNGDIDTGGPDTYPGTDPVAFVDSASGLTFTYPADVAFSSAATKPANFAACTYTPVAGYDPAVTYLCINPKGVMTAGTPDPEFAVSFRARIE